MQFDITKRPSKRHLHPNTPVRCYSRYPEHPKREGREKEYLNANFLSLSECTSAETLYLKFDDWDF